MIRTGVREKMVSFAVIFMVLFLVIESYMGDIQTVAVETEMLEPDGDLDLNRFRGVLHHLVKTPLRQDLVDVVAPPSILVLLSTLVQVNLLGKHIADFWPTTKSAQI